MRKVLEMGDAMKKLRRRASTNAKQAAGQAMEHNRAEKEAAKEMARQVKKVRLSPLIFNDSELQSRAARRKSSLPKMSPLPMKRRKTLQLTRTSTWKKRLPRFVSPNFESIPTV